MLDIKLATSRTTSGAMAVVVPSGDPFSALELLNPVDQAEADAFLDDVEHTGSPGSVRPPGNAT